jgi:hypothetical protein
MGILDLLKPRDKAKAKAVAKTKEDLRKTNDPVLAAAIRRADGDPSPRAPRPQHGVWKSSPTDTTARIKPQH